MTHDKTTFCRSLVFVSALAMAGGAALAEKPDRGPRDGDRQRLRQSDGDRDGRRQRGDRAEDGERGQRQRGDRQQQMHRRLFGGMDLTDDQKASIHETMKTFGDTRKAWHEANKDSFQAIRDKMREARQAKDKDAMQAAREEIKALMESAPKPDATHDQIRALLNEEQQATFDERIEKFRERMDKWKERRGDGTPGSPGPPQGRHGFAPPDAPGHDGSPMNGMDGPPRPDRRAHAARLFGNLDLTDEQRDGIRDTMRGDGTREEKMAAVRESLTEDQQTKLDENLEKMRKYREENKGERGERGDRRPRDGEGEGRRHHRRQNDDDSNDDNLDL